MLRGSNKSGGSRSPVVQRIPVPFGADFHFPSVVYSHGWCSLAPFSVEEDGPVLTRTLRMRKHSILRVHIAHRKGKNPSVKADSLSPLHPAGVARVGSAIASILHTESDLSDFYLRIRKYPRLRWAESVRAGRMLRGETFFEDTVKTILTTNCSWSLTTSMNNNLIQYLGTSNSRGWKAFPTAEEIAAVSPAFLRSLCKLGYRAEYVHELAVRCASGELDIEAFRHSTSEANEAYAELRSIKGIGDYAAANLLRMLGKFDYLGLDSWCRSRIAELYGNGNRLDDAEIERIYAPFEEWKGLAMWLDVTRDWYEDKFPGLSRNQMEME